jgi:pyridoxamine 5'-phosphate oxidase
MEEVRKNVESVRREFNFGSLDLSDVPNDPIEIMEQWLADAIAKQEKDPNAFVLSTVKDGMPDSRVVLLRDFTENGLTFFTNYQSKKGNDLLDNQLVAVNFYWIDLDRQVRIQGKVTKVNAKVSDEYFNSRPRSSQIGAWASNQSTVIASRGTIEERVAELEKKYEGQDVPRPEHWGGYLITPINYEFWQGRASRLHDRLTFHFENGAWTANRLAP